MNLAKDIRSSNNTENEEVNKNEQFPYFMWILRDFALQMVD